AHRDPLLRCRAMHVELSGGAHLRPLEEADADELFALTDRNRAHLEAWLPWVPLTRAATDSLEFIRITRVQIEDDAGMHLALVDEDGAIAGMAGFHRFDWVNRATSIGYW